MRTGPPGPAALLAALLAALALAGCLGAGTVDPAAAPGAALDHDLLDRLIGAPIALDHDHLDPLQHTAAHNLGFVAWSTLGVELGRNGFANFVFFEDDDEDLAFVAIDGDDTGGFVIADVADPLAIRPLGRYEIQGNGIQEVRVFPDGRHALMNVQEVPRADWLLDLEGAKDCTVCLHLVNVEDRANPRLVSVLPVDILGSHNMDIQVIGGVTYVFYVGQMFGVPNEPVGNYVGIAQLVEGPAGAQLVKVAEYRHEEAALEDQGLSFPHDVIVAEHPLTGRWIAYVSHWQGGAITVDVTDPLAPRELAVHDDPAPSDVSNIHWFAPEPRPRAGPGGQRLVAWSAPEIGGLETGTGVIRSYDVTDPASLAQLGTWQVPGELSIPGQFLLSPHIVQPDLDRGLLAVSHYHAGVWILDPTDPAEPRALGFYQPHGDPAAPYDGPIWWKKPNFDPEGFFPNVYQARWKDGVLWVTERGTGMYVLDYTGPVPGPIP